MKKVRWGNWFLTIVGGVIVVLFLAWLIPMLVRSAKATPLVSVPKETVIVRQTVVVDRFVTTTPAAPSATTTLAPSATPAVTVTLQPTPTAVVSPTLQAQASVVTSGTMPTFVRTVSYGKWNIQATKLLSDNLIVAGWLSRLKDPAPSLWRSFPNVPNVDVPEFRVIDGVNGPEVPDGMEYGTYSSPYCFSHPCDIPVGAWEYRYITGDYSFLGTECKGGCMLILINVMDQSFTWRNQDVDNGFTLRGRYFNGDALEWGVWGLVSYGSATMLNLPTLSHPNEVLNSGDPGNSGANCGNPHGCKSIDVTVVVQAGDAIIAIAKTTVVR